MKQRLIAAGIGLASGSMVAGAAVLSPHVLWWGAGVFFAMALLASYPLFIRYFGIGAKAGPLFGSTLMIAALYPATFLLMVGIASAYSEVYRWAAPEKWWHRYYSGRFVSGSEGILIGLCLASLLPAIGFAAVLRWLTGRWHRDLLAYLVVAALSSIPLAGLAAQLLDLEFQLALFPIGGMLFGLVAGVWLSRAPEQAELRSSSHRNDKS